ncbi:MAG: PHP domain-containing protein, partial [Vallitaleaceae bacterium]|nr:PHP domain-containing protein [Vallitaleaceae bacterium]
LAHPTLYKLDVHGIEKLVKTLVTDGLLGIEGLYPLYNSYETKYLRSFAIKYNLCITGGSDFHGTNKPDIDLAIGRGRLHVPDQLLKPLRALSSNRI